jgi:predicted DNA binding CopG/RHH family protein
MDYQKFQNFIKKYEFDDWDIKFLNDIAKSCILPDKIKPPKKKLYSIRLNEDDMQKLRQIAKDQWLPYQTLISSIIHKYVTQ